MGFRDVSITVHQHLPEPEFYIQNLLTKDGSLMLYGGVGARKSWLALDMAFAIATGSPWLGFATQQAKVAIANFEISPIPYAALRLRPIENRYQLQPNMLFEDSPGYMRLEEQEDFNIFRAAIAAIQPNVLILDCLQACYGGDENASQEASRWIHRIDALKEEFHLGIIVVHHSNKSLLATGMGRVRGTTKFIGWVDSVVFMAQQPSGIQLQFEKHRNSVIEAIPNMNVQFHQHIWTPRT